MRRPNPVDARFADRRRVVKAQMEAIAVQYANDPAGHAEALVRVAVEDTEWMVSEGLPREMCGMDIKDTETGAVICNTRDLDAMAQYRRYMALRYAAKTNQTPQPMIDGPLVFQPSGLGKSRTRAKGH